MLLSATGLGALAVNLFCAFLLARFRAHAGSLTRAAFLSARNDAVANIAIVIAGLVTMALISPWPDLVVGLGIFLMNLGAAREVFQAAKLERSRAQTDSLLIRWKIRAEHAAPSQGATSTRVTGRRWGCD
jgi:Co/Zn/Cd efflux system component